MGMSDEKGLISTRRRSPPVPFLGSKKYLSFCVLKLSETLGPLATRGRCCAFSIETQETDPSKLEVSSASVWRCRQPIPKFSFKILFVSSMNFPRCTERRREKRTQKTREGCGCPKFLAGRGFQQDLYAAGKFFPDSPEAQNAIPAKVWALSSKAKWLLEDEPRLRELSLDFFPPSAPQPS